MAQEEQRSKEWLRINWNLLVVILCLVIIAFGSVFMFFTPELHHGLVQEHGLRIFVLTFTLPVILFLLAMEKIPKEAGLSLLGTILGFAFGTG